MLLACHSWYPFKWKCMDMAVRPTWISLHFDHSRASDKDWHFLFVWEASIVPLPQLARFVPLEKNADKLKPLQLWIFSKFSNLYNNSISYLFIHPHLFTQAGLQAISMLLPNEIHWYPSRFFGKRTLYRRWHSSSILLDKHRLSAALNGVHVCEDIAQRVWVYNSYYWHPR